MRTPALYATSIICGFCMMALEMMGGRYLYPIYGSGIDVGGDYLGIYFIVIGRLLDGWTHCRQNDQQSHPRYHYRAERHLVFTATDVCPSIY